MQKSRLFRAVISQPCHRSDKGVYGHNIPNFIKFQAKSTASKLTEIVTFSNDYYQNQPDFKKLYLT